MAVDYLKTNLLGKTVYLERDVTDMDQNGHLLRYIWTEKIRPNNFTSTTVNAYLVERGIARITTYPPDTKYLNQLAMLEKSAKINNYDKC